MLLELLIGVVVPTAGIALMIWLVVALLGIGRSSSVTRERLDARA